MEEGNIEEKEETVVKKDRRVASSLKELKASLDILREAKGEEIKKGARKVGAPTDILALFIRWVEADGDVKVLSREFGVHEVTVVRLRDGNKFEDRKRVLLELLAKRSQGSLEYDEGADHERVMQENRRTNFRMIKAMNDIFLGIVNTLPNKDKNDPKKLSPLIRLMGVLQEMGYRALGDAVAMGRTGNGRDKMGRGSTSVLQGSVIEQLNRLASGEEIEQVLGADEGFDDGVVGGGEESDEN